MKNIIPSIALALVLTGCTTTSPVLSPALVQAAVQTGTAFGSEQYPQAVPEHASLAVYDAVFTSFGADWVNKRPQLALYLKAVCDGMNAGLPEKGLGARRTKALPPHL